MRRALLAAAVAAAAFGASAPATAAYQCVGAEKAGYDAGVCAGSWCTDECLIVAWTYCTDGIPHSICNRVDGLGAPPG